MSELKVIKRGSCSSETTQTPGMSRLAGGKEVKSLVDGRVLIMDK